MDNKYLFIFSLSLYRSDYIISAVSYANWHHDSNIASTIRVHGADTQFRSHSAAMQHRYPERWRYLSAHTRLAKSCVVRRQPTLLGRGRDRNQESKSKSRPGSRRGEKHLCNAARVRLQPFVQTFYSQVGGIVAAYGPAMPLNGVRCNCYVSADEEVCERRRSCILQVAIASRLTIPLFFAICILSDTKCALINHLSRQADKIGKKKNLSSFFKL